MWLVGIAAFVGLSAVVLLLGFLLLGALRAQGLLEWRLDQLEATLPSRVGRSGLTPGRRAPDFTLPSVQGRDISLHDFAGRQVLLVFVQAGCGPCREIVPELSKLARQRRDLIVLAINRASPEDEQRWAAQTHADFPVLIQEDLALSKRYEAFATPFAFLIDERGYVAAKGIVSQPHHLGYVLAAAVRQPVHRDEPADGAPRNAEHNPAVMSSAVAP